MNVSSGHEIVSEAIYDLGTHVPQPVAKITKLLRIKLEKYPTYYFTLANLGKYDADVSIQMTTNQIDSSCICNFVLQAGEIVTVPVPTGDSVLCNILTTQPIELTELSYQYLSASAELSGKAYDITMQGGVANSSRAGNRTYTLRADLGNISCMPVMGAAVYGLEVTTNRKLRVYRGRVSYTILGKVIFATREDFAHEMHMRNYESCIVNVVTRVQRKAATGNSNAQVWRV